MSELTRRERAAAQSENDRAAHEARRRPSYLPACPSSAVLLSRACGHHQAALIKCHNPLCPDCERERAGRIREKWEGTLAMLADLKLMTLTIANGHDLAERIATLRTSRKRLLQLRIGRNNRARIRRAVEIAIAQALSAGRIDQAKADKWRTQAERWLDAVARVKTSDGKSPKLRQLIKGLTFLEITHDARHGWHVHLHCIVSTRYTPQVVLQVMWHMATRGDGRIVDVRKIDDAAEGLAEVSKYVTKPNGIPDELGPTVIAALKGVRRLTKIGNIWPVEPEPLPCPGCDRPGCECGSLYAGMIGAQDIDLSNVEAGAYVTRIHDRGMSFDARVSLHRDDKGHLVWTASTLTGGELVLSHLSLSESREGCAWLPTGPPTGPPMSDADELHSLEGIEWALK